MKYSLVVFGVLCALSCTSYARLTKEEVDRELASLVCPPGTRPAVVGQKCPKGTRDPLDCVPTRFGCVRGTLEVEQVTTTPEPAIRQTYNRWGGKFRPEPWSNAGQIGPGVNPWRTATNENDPLRVKP